ETQARTDLEQALERERQNSYYQRIALADREWSANNLGRMEQLLQECPTELRGWEWHYLKRLPRKTLLPLSDESGFYCVAFSPQGQYLAASGRDGVIKFWDAHTGQPLPTFHAGEHIVFSVAFSPDGRRLAASCLDGRVKMWDLKAGTQLPDW